MRARAWSLGLLLAAGCSEDPLLVEAHPSLAFDPATLDFGPVAEGTVALRALRVSNVGPVPLSLTAAIGAGASAEWTVATATASVPARGTLDLEVRYAPVDRGADTGELALGSDDPEHRAARVALRGGPIAPRLDVSPDPVDFAPALSARTSRPVALKNVGLATLTLLEVRVDADANPDFRLRAPPTMLRLGPLTEVEVILDYDRSSRGAVGRLLIRSDDPDVPELAVRLLPDPLSACADGADNDGDALTDFPDDPGCTSATDGDETNPPECDDGMTMPCGTDVGECDFGARTCAGRAWGPCVQASGPTDEVCDGLDNDCDGRVDDAVTEACTIHGCAGARACVEGGAGAWTACLPTQPVAEACNGIDDDCDGTVDQGILESCVVNDCAGQHVCVPGGAGEFTACQVASQPEACNGLDDDCTGVADDGLPDLSCGVGACRRTAAACVGGAPGVCSPGTPGVEACNGLDDDCNGVADDLAAISCGVGACRRTVAACNAGAPNTCSPGAPGVEACNGLDDDCNGVADDLAAISCGVGACRRTAAACVGGAPGVCSPATPGVEACNGLDDDCNGVADDLAAISCGVGACRRTVAACNAGAPNTCSPGAPGVEACNGLDDDCNGVADDLAAISCGVGACRRTAAACVGGAPGVCSPATPGVEACNGLDDDCNGVADDLAAISCGVGACRRTVAACNAGAPNTCSPGAPGVEACNGLDDDCNGVTDEGVCAACGLMSTAPDPQEPNNTASAARPNVAWSANGTFTYDYDLTLPSGDSDWLQYNFPPVGAGSFAELTAQITCASWAGAGCGGAATVGLEAWYVDDFGAQLDGTHNGQSGLALVTSSGPVASFFSLNQRFRVRAYPSVVVCSGEAANAHLRVTVTWSP